MDGAELGDADAGHDARRTDGTGADAHLDAVGSGVRQGFSRGTGSDVTTDDLEIGEGVLGLANAVEHAPAVAVRGIDGNDVHADVDERLDALEHIRRDADGTTDDQAAEAVFAGVGVVLHLHDVLVGDQPFQQAGVTDDGKLLDLMALEDVLGLAERRADGGGDEVLDGHDVPDGTTTVLFEAKIAVGQNADKMIGLVDDGDAANAVTLHECFGVGHGGVAGERHGIHDHSGFGALDHAYLLGLLGDGHVLVDDPDAPLAGDGDGEATVGDGVHGGGDNGGVEAQAARQLATEVDFPGEDLTVGGE